MFIFLLLLWERQECEIWEIHNKMALLREEKKKLLLIEKVILFQDLVCS